MHPVIIILLVLAGLFLLFTFGGGYYMYRFATLRNDKVQKDCWHEEMKPMKGLSDSENAVIRSGWEYLVKKNWETVYITSHDGLRLCGHLLENPNARGVVIQVHGYRTSGAFDFSCAVEPFYNMGMSLLVIDQRAHGESGGKHITFGYYERYDVALWAKYVKERYPDLPAIMDGVSMGASTVMLACGVGYPDNVKAIIADCGYSSPGAICRKVLKQWFKLPPFPLYYGAKFWVKRLAKFDLDELSCGKALESLKDSGIKLLIAHGKKDDFVPYSMSEEIMSIFTDEDKATFVELFTAEEADHGRSYLICREGYDEAISRLLERAGI